MPSSFSGLFRALAWTDYHKRPGNAPGPGQAATAAFTSTGSSFSAASVQSVAGSSPLHFKLLDNIVGAATFDATKSFALSWLFTRSQKIQDDLLNHEQGHYDITALVSRDGFVDLMLLKLQTFSSAQAGLNAVQKITHQTHSWVTNIQKLYDREVHPEQNLGQSRGPVQQSWDRFIQTAFTQARASGTQAPDGTPHKVRLADVLTQNNKQI